MITEHGIVTQATPAVAKIKTKRTAACEGCTSKDSCGTIHRGQEVFFDVPNTLGVQAGDSVLIGMRTKSALLLTFLVYIVPILCLVIGALTGDALAPFLGINASFLAMVLGFSLFGLAFFILHRKSAAMNRKTEFRPMLIRKTRSASAPACKPSSK
ncbi:MAG: SoxR reducing system RseC family protein [Desulfotignum sp.]